MLGILSFLFFILGTAIGSFLNVVAYRSVHGDPKRPDLKKSPRSGLKKLDSILFGKSACPHCKKKLKPLDLIPIVSYLLLEGRCRACHKKISLQYPLIEAATGLLFAFTFYYWSANIFNNLHLTSYILHLVYLLFVVCVLIVLFTTDIVDGLLPNSIVLPAIVVVAFYKLILLTFGSVSVSSLSWDIIAALLTTAVFFAIVYFSGERALGGGDVKFVFFIALAVGWPAVLVSLFSGFLTGGLVAVMLILLGKKRFGQTVPLGPFLAIGAAIALFWGQQIIDLYLRAIR